eukprot:tig00000955_g5804.t1
MPREAKEAPVFGPLPSLERVPAAPYNEADLLEAVDDAVRLLSVGAEGTKLLLRHSDLRVECKRLDKLHYLFRVELDLDPIPPGPAARMLICRSLTKEVSDTVVSEEPVALLEPADPHDEDGLGASFVVRQVSHVFGARLEAMLLFACRRLADGSALSARFACDLDENNAWTPRGYQDKMHACAMWHVAGPESGQKCRLTYQFYERRFSNWMPDWLTTQFLGRFIGKMVLRARRLAFNTYAAMGPEAAAAPLQRRRGSFAPGFASGSAAAPLRWSSGALEEAERVGSSEDEGGYGYEDEDGARRPDPGWRDDDARLVVPPSATLFAFPPPPPSPAPGSYPPDAFFHVLGVGKPREELSRNLQPDRVYQLGRGQLLKSFSPPNAAALRQAEEVMRATLEVGIRFESLSLGSGEDQIVEASPEALLPPLEPKPRARPRPGGLEEEEAAVPPPLHGRRPLRATAAVVGAGAGAGAGPTLEPHPVAQAPLPTPPQRAPLASGAGPSPRPLAPLRSLAPSPIPPQSAVPALPSLNVQLPPRIRRRKKKAPPPAPAPAPPSKPASEPLPALAPRAATTAGAGAPHSFSFSYSAMVPAPAEAHAAGSGAAAPPEMVPVYILPAYYVVPLSSSQLQSASGSDGLAYAHASFPSSSVSSGASASASGGGSIPSSQGASPQYPSPPGAASIASSSSGHVSPPAPTPIASSASYS